MFNPFKKKPEGITIKFVPPHDFKSRTVTDSDLPRVLADAKQMQMMMHELVSSGFLAAVYALSHSQITGTRPLRFFVINGESPQVKKEWTHDQYVVLNPEIIRHTQVPAHKEEGCATFPRYPMKKVERYNRGAVRFQLIEWDGKTPRLSAPIEEESDGLVFQMFQHEIDHHNCKYIHKLETPTPEQLKKETTK